MLPSKRECEQTGECISRWGSGERVREKLFVPLALYSLGFGMGQVLALQRQPVLISELLPVCDAESIKLKSGYLEIFISNFSMLCLLPF